MHADDGTHMTPAKISHAERQRRLAAAAQPPANPVLVALDGMREATEEFIADDGLDADPERVHDLSALLRVREVYEAHYGGDIAEALDVRKVLEHVQAASAALEVLDLPEADAAQGELVAAAAMLQDAE